MRIQALREQAFADATALKPGGVEVAHVSPSGSWVVTCNASCAQSPECALVKTFSIPSEEYGTAFKIRIKQAEQKLNHHCREVIVLPDNKLQITLMTDEANNVTEKDNELAELIDLAYGPYKPNRSGMPTSVPMPGRFG